MKRLCITLALLAWVFCGATGGTALVANAAEAEPFGSNLFQGHFSGAAQNSVIQPGDRMVLRLWGGATFDGIVTVDPEGFVDLPDSHRILVSGLAQAPPDALEQAIASKLKAAGVDAQVYARPLDIQPVSVMVTGFVPKPGQYSGNPADSVLHFLDKAGGIDARRGTYRRVSLQRQGRSAGEFDLYPFVLNGTLPQIRFQNGDTLVVSERGPSVTASGEIRNSARFEFRNDELTGGRLLDLADPQPNATHASLTGTRNGAPYALYLPLRDFRVARLENGDAVRFLADKPSDTIMVETQGAVRGGSRFPVKRNARLRDLQNFIAVDPDRANLEGLYIKRKSVAARQKKAIEDSLSRLEQNAYTATSASAEEAQIRAKEAEMLTNFISKARQAEPEGIVVVKSSATGGMADLALEDGDIIVIPEKNDVVLVSGEVLMPQAIVWHKDLDMDDYIRSAGGFSNRANTSNLLVLRPGGDVVPHADSVTPGDQILVLPKVESKNLQAVKDISQVLYQVAIACKVIIDL